MLSIRSTGQRRRWPAAVLISAVAHGLLLLGASGYQRQVKTAPARLPLSVSLVPARTEPAQLPPVDHESSARDRRSTQPAPRRLAAPARAKPSPPPPAGGGAIAAPPADPGAPLDLTGDTLVTGNFQGTTSGRAGTGAGRKSGGTAPGSTPGAPLPGPDRSRAISLEAQSWSCPWPREGDAEQIDEQTVVIRVVVRSDGSVESAEVLADPGHGFGQAAMACALRTRFTPAQNGAGEPVRARSPPIKVKFTR